MRLRLNKAGDTLVEVLIAISVVSVVLAGAYVMTNRSLSSTRDAQERVNATKLAETQIEIIKGTLIKDSSKIFGSTVPVDFCIPPTNPSLVVQSGSSDLCAKMDMGGNSPVTKQPIFAVNVHRDGNNFNVTVKWTSSDGKSPQNVSLLYRAYQ